MMQVRTRKKGIINKVAKVAAVVSNDVSSAASKVNLERVKYAAYGAALLAFPTVVAFAQTDPAPTIDFDLTPFFTSLNTYLPIFMALFAVIGGIAGAMALSRYIIGAIVRAFSGGSIS